MIALLIFGILLMVTGLALFFLQPKLKEYERRSARLWSNVIGAVGTLLVLLSLVFGSITTIPAGHVGIVTRFQGVTGKILDQGLGFKVPYIDTIVKMSVQTQKYEVLATAASQDLQDVNTTIALNYHLSATEAATVYQTLGVDYIERLAAPAIQETVKKVTAQYIAEDLILRRDIVKGAITEDLSTRLQSRGIVVEAVSITNFQFSQVFTAAIEAKVSALQAVLEAENKLQRIKVEAQMAEAEAIGKANAVIAEAKGEAQSIQIVTEAQLAANKAISESLTPEVLQYIFYDRLGDNIKVIISPPDGNFVYPLE